MGKYVGFWVRRIWAHLLRQLIVSCVVWNKTHQLWDKNDYIAELLKESPYGGIGKTPCVLSST